MRKLLIGIVLLLSFIILGAALLLGNPHWLSPLIEQQLRKQGINAEISQLKGKLTGDEYQITALLSGNSEYYGVDVKQAQVAASIHWKQWLQQQPFIKTATLDEAVLVVDKNRLPQWQAAIRQLKKQPSSNNVSRYIPQDWSIKQGKIIADNQQLTLDARGVQDQQIRVIVHDHESGYVTMDYQKNQQLINLHSQQLNLMALTGHDAVLKGFDAVINTQNWAASRVTSRLLYQGMSSVIRVQGEKNKIELSAVVDEETIKATVRYDDYGAQLRFSEVNIAALAGLTPLLPKALTRMQVSGIADGVLEYDYEKGIRLFAVNLKQGTISHPELLTSRLSARLWLQNQQLKYRLFIDNGTLLFPTLFDQDSHRVTGELEGTYQLDKQLLLVNSLSLTSPDFQRLTASGSVQLDKVPVLDIQAQLTNVQLAKASRYLPKQMLPEVRHWLAKALVSGNKNQTTLTLKGALDQLMSADNSTFLISSQLSDSVLHYLPNNPNVHLRKANFQIDKKSLSVLSQYAEIGGLPLTVSVDIADLLNPVVDISAQIKKQSLAKMQAVAINSIAKPEIRLAQKIATASGLFDLNLSVLLNFSEKNATDTFHIRLHSDAAQMALKQYPDLLLKKTAVTVFINEGGLKNIKAKGQLNGQPIQIDLVGNDKGYRVDTFLTAEAIKILPQLKLISQAEAAVLKKFKLLSGKSRYKASMDFSTEGSLRQLDVTSALTGTRINIFDAVKKTAKQKNILILTYSAKKQYVQFHIDNMLMLKAGFDRAGELVGLVVDNDIKKRTYRPGIMQLYLDNKRLNATALNAFVNAYKPPSKEKKSRKTMKYQAQIDIKQLAFEGRKVFPLSIKGDTANVQLNSPMINGNIQYQENQLNAQLSRVEVDTLFELIKQTEINPGGRKVETISLARALPQLDINIEKVVFKGKTVGDFHLETSIRDGLYSIDQGLLSGQNYFLEISGYEAKEPQGVTTYIQADFKGEQLASVIHNFSLNEVIDAKNLDVSANLAWPGKAHTLNVQRSYGKAHMSALNVKLLTVSSGVGSVFGLMDVMGILKRISLDFKNLNSSKISFDTVQGHWNIGGGRAVTRDYYADGSIVALKVEGAIDLHRREFDDVNISVIPRASNVLPIVGAVAGGVVGVAAGFVIQQVIGDNLDEAVGIPYEISGTWEKPHVEYKGNKTSAQTQQLNNK